MLELAKVEFRAIGDRHGIAECTRFLAYTAKHQGCQDRAGVLFNESLEKFEELGVLHAVQECSRELTELYSWQAPVSSRRTPALIHSEQTGESWLNSVSCRTAEA
ncbi:hypothetical protein CALCODRAFT_69603 [Calocera cornea HHB12733]|uniref:Uncharacterized protein n=1 Tax=Calocera cornea HHB12733 TaxID=1353952 RepID=A0A165DIS0_9BASI|nr:hypothetical protein CALCODRAFT_69603 [Calocera cornea HHB12733]